MIGWVFEKPRRPFPRHTHPPVLAQAHAPTHRCSCQLGVGCLHGTISGQNLQTWNMEVRMLLLLLVANLGNVRAQEKPRLGRDGRPLLNKPKVGHAAFYLLHLRHIQSIHVKQYPSNSAVKMHETWNVAVNLLCFLLRFALFLLFLFLKKLQQQQKNCTILRVGLPLLMGILANSPPWWSALYGATLNPHSCKTFTHPQVEKDLNLNLNHCNFYLPGYSRLIYKPSLWPSQAPAEVGGN